MSNLVRTTKGRVVTLGALLGLGLLVTFVLVRRTEASPYTNPFYSNNAPVADAPGFMVQDIRYVDFYGNPGASSQGQPVNVDDDDCYASVDTSIAVDAITGDLNIDFPFGTGAGLFGRNGLGLTLRSMVSGNSQFGCPPALPTWQTTVEPINGGNFVNVRRPSGRIDAFVANGQGGFTAPAGVYDTLLDLGGGLYRLVDTHGNSLDFNGDGMPTSAEDTNGNTVTFTQDANRRTTSITNRRGQTATFTHNGANQVTSVVNFDGTTTEFTYDANGGFESASSGAVDGGPPVTVTASRDARGRWAAILLGDDDDDDDGGGGGGGGGSANPPKHFQFAYVETTNKIASVTIDTCTTTFDYQAGVTIVTGPLGNVHRYHFAGNKITKIDQLVNSQPKYETTFEYSGELLAAIVFPRGNRVEFSWDAKGNLLERRHKETNTTNNGPTDIVHAWTYDANSFETSYTNPRGHTWDFTRDGAGNLTQVTHPNVSNPGSQTASRSYQYNARGQITRITDEESNITDLTYFTTGSEKYLLKKIEVDPAGLDLETTLTYDSAGNIASITDPRGHKTTLTWDAYNRLVERQAPAPLDYRVKLEYDSSGRLIAREVENIDKDGVQDTANPWIRTDYEWDARDNLIKIVDEIDATTTRQTTLEYDCNDNRIRVTKPEGNKEAWEYDERDRVSEHIRGEGATEASERLFEYDDNDNLVKVTDGRGNDTTVEYDKFDRRTRVVNALGHYAQWTYDPAGNVTKLQRLDVNDVELQRETYFYDTRNRLWKRSALFTEPGQTHPDAVTTWERFKTGEVKTRTSPSSAQKHYEFDAARRLVKVTDAMGNEWSYGLDAAGNMTSLSFKEMDGVSSVVHDYTAAYDELNRRTQWTEIDRTNSANKLLTKTFWDSRSNLVFRINAEGNPTRWTYDALDRLVKRERALATGATIDDFTSAQVTQWGFDKNNRLISHKDDGNNESTWDHDALDRVTKLTYPDLNTVTYEYDDEDNVTKTTDPAGNVVDDTFDVLNRNTSRSVTLATGFLGTTSETRTFDALNRIVTNEDNDYKLEHEYAVIGFRSFLAEETQSYVGMTAYPQTYSKTYDSRGNLAQEAYPTGAALSLQHSYNAINQLTSVTDGTNTIASYTYVGLRRKTIAFQNGATQTNTYTGFRSEVAGIHHETSAQATILKLEYGYNKVHDRVYERFGGAGASGDAFEYDSIRRLTTAWMGSSDPTAPSSNSYVKKVEYNYDDDGNRTSIVTTPYQQSATTTSYTTNNLNQYTQVAGTNRTHDANGNLTDDGTHLFSYDYRNQIVQVKRKSDSTVIAGYRYDALGRRVEKSTDEGVQRFILCTRDAEDDLGNLGNVMGTTDGSGNWKQTFVHHGNVDEIAMLEQADVLDYDSDGNTTEKTRSFYHTNALGSVMEITDANEAVVVSYRYDPYGKVTVTRGGQAQTTDPLGQGWGYTGRFRDEETELWYYRARYYDPTTGRFLQRDPLGVSSGPNMYEYSRSSPVVYTDPSGLIAGAIAKKVAKKAAKKKLKRLVKEKIKKPLKKLGDRKIAKKLLKEADDVLDLFNRLTSDHWVDWVPWVGECRGVKQLWDVFRQMRGKLWLSCSSGGSRFPCPPPEGVRGGQGKRVLR